VRRVAPAAAVGRSEPASEDSLARTCGRSAGPVTAQKKLDAAYGDNVIRVSQAGPISALSAAPNVDGSQVHA